MAKPVIDLSSADEVRDAITDKQIKEIRKMFSDMADEVRKKADALEGKDNISSVIRKKYLDDLEKELRKQVDANFKELKKVVESDMQEVSESVVQCVKDYEEQIGMPIANAWLNVPVDAVTTVSSGKLYAGNWTLSSRIWGVEKKVKKDINTVIAKGIAENKSAYDIAKDLEKYVDPKARKDWSWSKVYPGTNKKVDYSAQRLARTMVSHAYQFSFVESTKDNPHISKYKWISSHDARVCPICRERDGQLFEKDNLPLDHPMGRCTFVSVFSKSMMEISDELAEWVKSPEGTFPELDKYMMKRFGTDSFNKAKKMAGNIAGNSGKIKSKVGVDVPSSSVVKEAMMSADLFDGFDEVKQGQVNAALYEYIGIGAKPKVVDKIPDGMKEYYRGISNSEGKAAEFFNQLKGGKLYVAPSTSGNGIDFANQGNEKANFDFARGFATKGGGNVDGLVVKAAFSEDMKLVKLDDLDKMVKEFSNSKIKQELLEKTQSLADDMKREAFDTMDQSLYKKGEAFSKLHSLIENDERGIVAVLNGYDGVDSDFWTEYCIFNRTKLIIEKEAIKVK